MVSDLEMISGLVYFQFYNLFVVQVPQWVINCTLKRSGQQTMHIFWWTTWKRCIANKRHKKSCYTLMRRKMEMKDLIWAANVKLTTKWKRQDGECFIFTDKGLSEKQWIRAQSEPVWCTRGDKPAMLSALQAAGRLAQWHDWKLFISPLHRQVCSSWGVGLQVCHRHHHHSWVRGYLQLQM